MFPIYETQKQKEYDGPEDLRIFADILPYIGEVVISFSRLERRLTWGIESLLYSTRDEADKMESSVRTFTSRVEFLEVIGKHVSRESNTEMEFDTLLASLKKANTFRNYLLHNAFAGISQTYNNGEAGSLSVLKNKFSKRPEQRSYKLSIEELRNATIENFALCSDMQRWILGVRPGAENRIP